MSGSDQHANSHKLPDGTTVLVADDDPVVRRTVRRMLDLEQAAVVEARDGEHAIRLVDQDEAHLLDTVLTDLEMPVVSGALGTVAPLVLQARAMRARARQARSDAAESRTLAERQMRIARHQHAACGELMAALARLRQRM